MLACSQRGRAMRHNPPWRRRAGPRRVASSLGGRAPKSVGRATSAWPNL